MSVIQKNIVKIIEEKGLVKKGVAKRAGMTQQALSDILAGRKVIRADMVPTIARALNVGIAELFEDDEKGA
ncbi:MAG: helix-turn-helix transcriptional regulator [Clostridia bacterium]|nr:helix-turn-helix transcriptional regulator [Clostridia bacterium]